MRRALPSLLAFTALLRADFNPARWQFRRSLMAGEAQQVSAVTLDRAVYAGA